MEAGVAFQATGRVEYIKFAGAVSNPAAVTIILSVNLPGFVKPLRYRATLHKMSSLAELVQGAQRGAVLGRRARMTGIPTSPLSAEDLTEVVQALVEFLDDKGEDGVSFLAHGSLNGIQDRPRGLQVELECPAPRMPGGKSTFTALVVTQTPPLRRTENLGLAGVPVGARPGEDNPHVQVLRAAIKARK